MSGWKLPDRYTDKLDGRSLTPALTRIYEGRLAERMIGWDDTGRCIEHHRLDCDECDES